ncbi:GTPase Era [Kiritimatiellaeota bacterium B1221]|nr:GTPase Era [Kiritimatiellaeota bacterium B1221]
MEPEQSESPSLPQTRAGMVAVVGAANAGKSSLINRLTGEKISIVSPVAQTTRNIVRAILTEDRGQVVFLDTPGVHRSGKKQLNQQMNKMARGATEGMDVVMLVMDRAEKPRMEVEGWMRKMVQEKEGKLLFLLNKCDRDDKSGEIYREMWAEISAETENPPQPHWMEVSASMGLRIDELRDWLMAAMPAGPLLFPEDMVSDFPRKLAIGDFIREKFLMRLRQELPHSIAVWVESLVETDKKWKIEAHVLVRQNSQKGMVIGNKGRVLKAVRGEAASELYEIYGVRIDLTLIVKVEKDWDKNFWILRKLGYA